MRSRIKKPAYMTIRCDADLREVLTEVAEEENRSLANLSEKILKDWVRAKTERDGGAAHGTRSAVQRR